MEIDEVRRAAARPGVLVVSSDVFDTVLLRDDSTETGRLAEAARHAARSVGVDPEVLVQLRWWAHEDAYRAVAVREPTGEARLCDIWSAVARSLGLGAGAAAAMHRCEVEVDATHLSANRELIDVLAETARRGLRVVALSDTYYHESDLRRLLDLVAGTHPFASVYSSADIGLTKHTGTIFDAVARAESVPPGCLVHVGDHPSADVARARAAGWSAVHLPRHPRRGVRRAITRARAVPDRVRRSR